MQSPTPHDSRSGTGHRLTTTGLLGYVAVLAALLALVTAPLVTAGVFVFAGLTATLVREVDRPDRGETTVRETTSATTVTADTASE